MNTFTEIIYLFLFYLFLLWNTIMGTEKLIQSSFHFI